MPSLSEHVAPRVLVMGCGSIGTRHIQNLLALGVKTIVAYDPRADRRQDVKTRFPIEVVDALPTAWAYRPTAAVIATPTDLHVPLALEAAQHGCHLFIEKPLSDRCDEAVGRLLTLVRERKLLTLVGCNLRFHPTLRAVKQLCDERVVGRIVSARVEYGQYLPDWHPWEDYRQSYSARQERGGGVILDAIHELDYSRWLFGDVVDVTAVAGKVSRLEIDTEDVAAILLRFASGVIGEIHLDYVQRVASRSCHLIGEEGTIRWDFGEGQTRWYRAATRQWQTVSNPDGWELNQMYLDEMRHFLKCLDAAEQPLVDVVDAARTLEVALAAKQAAQTGRAVTLSSRETQGEQHAIQKAAVGARD